MTTVINVDIVLRDLDGKARKDVDWEVDEYGRPVFETNDVAGAPPQRKAKAVHDLTFGRLCAGFVNAKYKGEEDLSWDKMRERARVARKLMRGGQQKFQDTETVLLRDLARKGVGDPELVLQIYEVLDGEPDKGEEEKEDKK